MQSHFFDCFLDTLKFLVYQLWGIRKLTDEDIEGVIAPFGATMRKKFTDGRQFFCLFFGYRNY